MVSDYRTELMDLVKFAVSQAVGDVHWRDVHCVIGNQYIDKALVNTGVLRVSVES